MTKRRAPEFEPMLLVSEMAAIARTSEKTILRAIKNGELKAIRLGRGYRSTRRQFREFLNRRIA